MAAFVLVAGSGVAFQTWINGMLGQVMSSPLAAATVNNFAALFVALLLVVPRGALVRAWRSVRARRTEFRPWWFAAGAIGPVAITAINATSPIAGLAATIVALVLGQLLGSLLADTFGIGPGGRKPLTVWRVFGIVLALAAVTVSAWGQGEVGNLTVLPIVAAAGAAIAVQQAANGHITALSGNAAAMSVLNFTIGGVVCLVLLGVASFAGSPLTWSLPWWGPLGGIVGMGVGVTIALAVRPFGVLWSMLGLTAGQSLTAFMLDVLAPISDEVVGFGGLVGALLAVVAVAVAAIPGGPLRGRQRPPGE